MEVNSIDVISLIKHFNIVVPLIINNLAAITNSFPISGIKKVLLFCYFLNIALSQ